MGFGSAFQRLTAGLSRTRESLLGKLQRVFVARNVIDEEFLNELEQILLGADVGIATTQALLEEIRRRVKTDRYESLDELMRLIREEVAKLIRNSSEQGLRGFSVPETPRPFVIMVVGVNGAGKTTTIGKLAYRFSQAGYSVLVGAGDTFRAAANEQLELWSRLAKVDIVRQHEGADPGAVAYDTVHSALAHGTDVVILDTAGRLHTKTNLMEELKKVVRVMAKLMPGAPHEALLVLDATTGQNALQQAKQFGFAVPLTGLVITKLDGTAKGGVVLALSQELNLPVKYIGVGENLEDLQPFDAPAFVQALLIGNEEKRIPV
jgi:fused signal recognition particle receptor